ncbi:HypC/HybG/HupF family hydrogenase formation chaperone [Primorskyibacter sp. 2E233]|uniref:HypC/HybG/HupF family hydrogenase formation chaperone n=1 Tax=Primorskyibacter sp. 2E233 TaxID=3413431 RepID=UPI003BF27072
MCLGIPMQVIGCDGIAAQAREGEHIHLIDMSLTGPQPPGTWILTFLGAAREVLDPDQADKITRALGGLRALMEGQGLGDAFADLDDAAPQLPPHLQAALNNGKTTA